MTIHPAHRPAETARLLEAARTARSRWLAARLALALSALRRGFGARPGVHVPHGAR